MNQGRIWCVVNPTVGLPLFLGSVAAISFIVHGSVLGNTTWMSRYWQGAEARRAADSGVSPNAVAAATQGVPFTVSVVPQLAADGTTSFSVVVTPVPGAGPAVAERPASGQLALSTLPGSPGQ